MSGAQESRVAERAAESLALGGGDVGTMSSSQKKSEKDGAVANGDVMGGCLFALLVITAILLLMFAAVFVVVAAVRCGWA